MRAAPTSPYSHGDRRVESMSYILDALKKSERERKRAAIPDPLTVQEVLPPARRGPGIRAALVVGTLLVMTLFSGLLFGIWYAQKTSGLPADTRQVLPEFQAQGQADISGESTPQADADERQHIPAKELTTAENIRDSSMSQQKQKMGRDDTERKSTEREEEVKVSPSVNRSEPERGEVIPPPDRNRLYSLKELPVALRQKLPDFTVSVFLYSDDPATRILRMNGMTMKEGQQGTDGLKLEEIMPDGAIFSYMKYRFRVRLP